jgi:hypothetical protein
MSKWGFEPLDGIYHRHGGIMRDCQARCHRGCENLVHLFGSCLVRIIVVYMLVTIALGLVNSRFEGDLDGLFFLSFVCAGEILPFQFLLELEACFNGLDYFILFK